MAYLVIDTETTGLKPGYIAQLAAIKIDNGKVTGFNSWFKVKEMEEGAARANGLSVDLCAKLSEGKEFYDRLDDIELLLEGVTDIYGYNTKFDKLFLETELARCSLSLENIAYCDVMPDVKKIMNVKKGFKLSDAIEFFKIEDKVGPLAQKIFGSSESLHDARFDVAATLLLARKLNRV